MTDKADEQVEIQLKNWSRWMHASELPDGCPTKACGGVRGYTNMDLDNVAAYESLDMGLAEACNAAIDDLHKIESCAIHHQYLHAVYRFNRELFPDVLARAKQNLKPLLAKRNVWLGE